MCSKNRHGVDLEFLMGEELTWIKHQLQSALHTPITEEEYEVQRILTEDTTLISKGESAGGNMAGFTFQDRKQISKQ